VTWTDRGLSLMVDLVPGIGSLKAAADGWENRNVLTGQPVSTTEAMFGIVLGAIPGGGAARAVKTARALDNVADAARAVDRVGDSVRLANNAGDLGKAQPDIVFRRLSPDERGTAISQGLRPTEAGASMSPTEHVLGTKPSPYISLTRDYDVSLSYDRNATPILEIDLSKVPSKIIDLTDPKTLQSLEDPRAIYNATRDAEVLIRGPIPPEAIGRIHYP
jgi:hypothetical protein